MTAAAWLVDLDGTLYDPRPLKVLMGLELLLLGPGSLGAIRAFRAEHEVLRELELERTRAPSSCSWSVRHPTSARPPRRSRRRSGGGWSRGPAAGYPG